MQACDCVAWGEMIVSPEMWAPIYLFFGYIPEEGFFGYRVTLFFIFSCLSPYYCPQWLCQLTSSVALCEGSVFCTATPTLVMTCFVGTSHSKRCEVLFYCGLFVCISEIASEVDHFFSYIYWPFACLLGKVSGQVCFPVLNCFFFNC